MNGILAVDKPAGVSSSLVVLQLQKIFTASGVFARDLADAKRKVHEELTSGTRWQPSKIANRVKNTKIKVGHGGTLDPLARGVLVVGVGSGTKKLLHYLGECTKTYEARALLGQQTTTGDSEGEVIMQTETAQVSLADLRAAARKFVGHSKQTPPVYSALKVDGKPLYEYARKGIPVPKLIKPRDVSVHLLEIHDDYGPSSYQPLQPLDMAKEVFCNQTLNDHALIFSDEYVADPDVSPEEKNTHIVPRFIDPALTPDTLPCVHLTASVGSGTYIRSLISDLGRAVGSSAHMTELTRTKQAEWVLGKNVFAVSDFTDRDERVWGPVLKCVFERGASVDLAAEFAEVELLVLPMLEAEKAGTAGASAAEGDAEGEYGEQVVPVADLNKKDATLLAAEELRPELKRQKIDPAPEPRD